MSLLYDHAGLAAFVLTRIAAKVAPCGVSRREICVR
jgi:hypothetical protein